MPIGKHADKCPAVQNASVPAGLLGKAGSPLQKAARRIDMHTKQARFQSVYLEYSM